MEKSKKRLGEILKEMGMISDSAIEEALELQKEQPGLLFGEALIQLGYVDEEKVLWALAEQHNISYVSIHLEDLDPSLIRKIPRDFALKYQVLPLYRIGEEVAIATSCPQNIPRIEKLREFLKDFSGMTFQFSLAHPREIEEALSAIYAREGESSSSPHEVPWESQEVRLDPTGTALLEEILERSLTLECHTLWFVFHPVTGRVWGEGPKGFTLLGDLEPDWQEVLQKKLSLSYPYLQLNLKGQPRTYQIVWSSGPSFERFARLFLVEPFPTPVSLESLPLSGLPKGIWLFCGPRPEGEALLSSCLKHYAQQDLHLLGFSPKGGYKIPEVLWMEEEELFIHTRPDLAYLDITEQPSRLSLIEPLLARGVSLLIGAFYPNLAHLICSHESPPWLYLVEYLFEVAQFPLLCDSCKVRVERPLPSWVKEFLSSSPELYLRGGCSQCQGKGYQAKHFSVSTFSSEQLAHLWSLPSEKLHLEYLRQSQLFRQFLQLLEEGRVPLTTLETFGSPG